MATQSLTLQPSGSKMPLLGFGTWKVPKDSAADIVYKAIASGYRHVDCACDYGNEVQVGQGIKKAIADGLVTREELFVTSKEHVAPAFNRTLSDLGLDYIDLYLIHFPISLKYVPFEERYPPEWANNEQDPVPVHETWAEMEKLVQSGKTKNIGVSNFPAILLMDLLSYAKVKPAVLHIEAHPYLNNSALIKQVIVIPVLLPEGKNMQLGTYAQSQGLQVTGYSNFGPASYVELGSAAAQSAVPLFKEDRLTKIAAQHKKTVAQVILRWLVQNKISVIPKSLNPVRISQNADIFNFDLSAQEMETIDGMNIPLRLNDPGVYANIPIYA
ncbi:NAD(P)H-dependent D-xylose reductase (XR) [Mortierella polycephala]|uniref:NAD(P)H-dependent D-xylose reductase (XR) n=1 Tax=Mortierella polycephala TaxID=41804 RepID=A0A9P6Q6U2_9FUNG|nr:NAD(P)H-dependent D-xylose reductase (XR) [Mortierella polycephala]